jgi:hypothetical protein
LGSPLDGHTYCEVEGFLRVVAPATLELRRRLKRPHRQHDAS